MTEQRPWRIRMLDFVAYMRRRGHHYTWMHRGQIVIPVGMVLLKFHDNDNRVKR